MQGRAICVKSLAEREWTTRAWVEAGSFARRAIKVAADFLPARVSMTILPPSHPPPRSIVRDQIVATKCALISPIPFLIGRFWRIVLKKSAN
jgi:hypothetical protein